MSKALCVIIVLSLWLAVVSPAPTPGVSLQQRFARTVAASSLAFLPLLQPCFAGLDPALLRDYAKPGEITRLYGEGNIETKLKSLKEAQDSLDAADVEFTPLSSGASYREYRIGKGDRVVKQGSTVYVAMSVRCKSFTTQKEPGGVQYFSTAKDTPGNELSWEVGSGALLPALEEGMMGMKRNAIRRIEIPSQLVFRARDAKQLPLPSPTDDDGNRRFKNLFKTDATLLFEVLINKIDEPPSPVAEVVLPVAATAAAAAAAAN